MIKVQCWGLSAAIITQNISGIDVQWALIINNHGPDW